MHDRHKRRHNSSTRLSRSAWAWVLIGAGGLALLISLSFLFRPSAGETVRPARPGSAIGDFQLPDLNGDPVRLSDYSGMTVLINTWATWCPPCRAEMPDLVEFYQNHRHQNFVILAINAGESAAKAGAFAGQIGVEFPVLLDTNYRVLDSLGIQSYPTSILIGPDGLVQKIKIGMFLPGELEEEIGPFLQD